MTTKLKILHLLNHSYPDVGGYAIRSFNIINSQRQYGLDPIVLTSPKHELEYPQNPERFEETLYYRTSRKSPPGLPFNAYVVYALLRQIPSIYREHTFDLLHAHSPSLCGLAAMRFSARTGIPFVYEVRAFWEDAAEDAGKYKLGSPKYYLTRFLESLVLRRAHAVTTIASYLKGDIEKRRGGRGNVFLVPNGVDARHFVPRPPDEELKKTLGLGHDPVIGFIGSFYRYEGLDVLLRALTILQAQGVKYKALLVGSGEMDAEWRQLAKDLGLTDVIFPGRIAYEDVLRYYSVFDICVYPRNRKRVTELVTPLKPLEAMAMEKFVIGSDVGGIKELLEDGKGGLLFPAENHEALAQLLKSVCENPSHYKEIVTAGKQIVQTKFSWISHAERYANIYKAILSATPSKGS
jgi:glycogen synthase